MFVPVPLTSRIHKVELLIVPLKTVYLESNEEPQNLQSSQNRTDDEIRPPSVSHSPVSSSAIPNPPPLQKSPFFNQSLMWAPLTNEEIEREVAIIRSVLE